MSSLVFLVSNTASKLSQYTNLKTPTGDGRARAFSIPGLKEIASTRINETLDARRFPDAIVTSTGDIIGWTGPSEIAMMDVWGAGDDLTRSLDKVFNVEALIPPRPTISNMQWLSGTTYITPADMDKLSKLSTPCLKLLQTQLLSSFPSASRSALMVTLLGLGIRLCHLCPECSLSTSVSCATLPS